MTNDMILNALKGSAWQRAKAELVSIGYMDFPPALSAKDWEAWSVHADRRREVINAFIAKMEAEELYL